MVNFLLVTISLISMISITAPGILLTIYIDNNIDATNKNILNDNFDHEINNIISLINDNFRKLHNQVYLYATAIDQYFDINATQFSDTSNIRQYTQNIIKNSDFNIYGMTSSKFINDIHYKNAFLNISKKIYNNSNMIIYGLYQNGTYYNVDEFILPVLLLSFTNQPLALIGVPAIGLLNLFDIQSTNLANVTNTLYTLLNMSDRIYALSLIIYTVLPDNTLFTNMVFNTKYKDWLIGTNFNPTVFLKNIIKNANKTFINIHINDTNGHIFDNEPIDDIILKKQIVSDYITSKWTITFGATHLFNSRYVSSFRTIVFVLLVLIFTALNIISLLFINILYYVHNKKMLLSQISFSKKLDISHQSIHYILHEIRNILSYPYSMLSIMPNIEQLSQTNIDVIKSNVKSAVLMSTSILDFELFLMNNYIPKYNNVNIQALISNNIITLSQKIMYYSNIGGNVIIDDSKYMEIFNNGLVNACKYNNNNIIIIRTQLVNDFIFTEIINTTNSISGDIETLFIPKFLENNKQIYDTQITNKFVLDLNIFNKIKNNFLSDLQLIYVHSGNSEQYIYSESSGFGLGLCRLIAKALNGDAGIVYKNDLFNFWFAVKNNDFITIQNNDRVGNF